MHLHVYDMHIWVFGYVGVKDPCFTIDTCSKSCIENLCPIGEGGRGGEARPLSSVAADNELL